MAQAYSAIANGGVLVRPNLVRMFKTSEGTILPGGADASGRRILEPATAQTLTGMLQTVVEEGGTGVKAAVPGFSAAGKTGTARKLSGGTYSSKHLVASFAGFCPADNPRLTVVVIIDEPQTMTYGGQSAAPAFSRIAQQVLNYLNVAPRVQVAAGALPLQAAEHKHLAADRAG